MMALLSLKRKYNHYCPQPCKGHNYFLGEIVCYKGFASSVTGFRRDTFPKEEDEEETFYGKNEQNIFYSALFSITIAAFCTTRRITRSKTAVSSALMPAISRSMARRWASVASTTIA